MLFTCLVNLENPKDDCAGLGNSLKLLYYYFLTIPTPKCLKYFRTLWCHIHGIKTLTSRHVTGQNATLTSIQSFCHRYRIYVRWKICFLHRNSIIMSMSYQHIHAWNFRIICLLFPNWPLKSTILAFPAKIFKKIAVYRDSGNCIYANQRWQFTKKTWTYQRHPSNKTKG